MNIATPIYILIFISAFLFSEESEANETSERNVSPTIEIRYDDFLNDLNPTSSIGLMFEVEKNRYAGFDVNTTDNETRILVGWNWTMIGIGTKEIEESGDTFGIFSFGVKYSVLKGMYSTVEYVMVDDPGTNDFLRLAMGVKF